MSTASVYLIPSPLFENESAAIPQEVRDRAVSLKYYFVENIRTARRVLKLFDKSVDIDAIHFEEMNHRTALNISLFQSWLKAGLEVGIMSEAGLPAIADPGNELVATAHRLGARVVPYVGPSSIFLSLIASGMNGQHFEFLGYLPVEHMERSGKIKELETKAAKNQTQIFIETPYRNRQLLESLLKQLNGEIYLCVAWNITAPDQTIIAKTIKEWKSMETLPDLHKKPCIFLVGRRAV